MFALVIFLLKGFDSFGVVVSKCSELGASSELWIFLVSLVDVDIFIIVQIIGDLNCNLDMKTLANFKLN